MKNVLNSVVIALVSALSLSAVAYETESYETEEYETVFQDKEQLLEEPLEFNPAFDSSMLESNSINVTFKNKCYDDIYVAVHYKDMDGVWITKGWFKIAAYANAFLFSTKNRNIYYTAESANGNHKWTGDDLYKSVRGSAKKYGFKKKVGPSTLKPYNLSITCNG
jgi:hypothetical protein